MPTLLASFWMPDAATMRLVMPELVLLATVVAVMVAAMLLGRDTRVAGIIALCGALATAAVAGFSFSAVSEQAAELFGVVQSDGSVGPGMLVADRLSMFFRLFIAIFLAAIVGMWFLFDAARERHAAEFHVLLLSSAIGMMLMSSTVNLLMMIIAIELASMPSYALAGFDRGRRIAAEASVKYVVFGAATSGFMIFGTSLVFGLFGTLHVPALMMQLAGMNLGTGQMTILSVALLAVFAGIAFKISAVPFHFWCPDVFEGASLPVATWLSVASKAAGIVLLVRLIFVVSAPSDPSFPGVSTGFTAVLLPTISFGVGIFAIITSTVANLAAYLQTNVRRMLAYSSIAHAGYMLAAGAIVVRGDGASVAVISAVVQYLVVYMFMNLGAFMSIGLVASDTDSEEMPAFRGLGWRDPATAISLTICLVSLVGLPPLGGFIVKFVLLGALVSSAYDTTSPLLWAVIFSIVINTAISLFYYARVIREMFLRGDDVPAGALRAPAFGKAALHVCAVVLLLTGTLLIGNLRRNGDAAAKQAYTAQPVVPAVAAMEAPRK